LATLAAIVIGCFSEKARSKRPELRQGKDSLFYIPANFLAFAFCKEPRNVWLQNASNAEPTYDAKHDMKKHRITLAIFEHGCG